MPRPAGMGHGYGTAFSPTESPLAPEHGDHCRHRTFTSPGPDRDRLSALLDSCLDSCLLTDDEYAAGSEHWKQLPSSFDSLIDPVT